MESGNTKNTERESSPNIMKMYLDDISKIPPLSSDAKIRLFKRLEEGDHEAKKRLIEANLKLVIHIAKRYTQAPIPFQDMVAEGNLGLIRAVEKFSLSRGCQFSTYAIWWIKQSIERAIINQSKNIRLPAHICLRISRIVKVIKELSQTLEREPTAVEISQYISESPEDIERDLGLLKKTFSLDAALSEKEGLENTLLDKIPAKSEESPFESVEKLDRLQQITCELEKLSDNEKNILWLRYGLGDEEPQTLEAIGKKFGVTRERIRQIEKKTILKLRKRIFFRNRNETCSQKGEAQGA